MSWVILVAQHDKTEVNESKFETVINWGRTRISAGVKVRDSALQRRRANFRRHDAVVSGRVLQSQMTKNKTQRTRGNLKFDGWGLPRNKDVYLRTALNVHGDQLEGVG